MRSPEDGILISLTNRRPHGVRPLTLPLSTFRYHSAAMGHVTPQQTDLSAQAQWLDVAAEEKASSVIRLAPPGISSLVDIGSGAGVVLAVLDRMNFAEAYWACEPVTEFCEQIERREIRRLRGTETCMFDDAFPGQTFDLAILSHVVEHLLTPASLVAAALCRAKYVIVEVPIEANVLGRGRHMARKVLGHVGAHAAGHVQFFSRASARSLMKVSGGKVLESRGYFPRAPYAAQATRAYQRAVLAASRVPRLANCYYEHYAMLATRATIDEWDHHYARPE